MKLDLTGAPLFYDDSFDSSERLDLDLYEMKRDFLDPIYNADASEGYIESEINARQNVIASNVAYHVCNSKMADTAKLTILNAALEHPVFQPEQVWQEIANQFQRSIYTVKHTLFSDKDQHHEPYATEAINLLEAVRDQFAESCVANGRKSYNPLRG